MQPDKFIRNMPPEKGENQDPQLRDNTGQQPGISTISSSESDEQNNKLTETAKDGFKEDRKDSSSDKIFDEGEE